jgi:hypothetical protein
MFSQRGGEMELLEKQAAIRQPEFAGGSKTLRVIVTPPSG